MSKQADLAKPAEPPRLFHFEKVERSTSEENHVQSLSGGQKKVLVEVESWDRSKQRYVPEIGATSDQGPYQFRQILRPTCYGSNKSGQSSEECIKINGHFDFRKLLRRTDHAPTDTLKRCKGLNTAF